MVAFILRGEKPMKKYAAIVLSTLILSTQICLAGAQAPKAMPPSAEKLAENHTDPVLRSNLAVDMFASGCFHLFWDEKAQTAWLTKNFDSVPADKTAPYLKSVGAKQGTVWLTSTSEIGTGRSIEMAMVVEPDRRCHAIAYGTDEAGIHAAVKRFADDAKKNLPDQKVDHVYKAKSGSTQLYDQSVVTITEPKSKAQTQIVVDTTPGGLRSETAIMSFYTNFKP
jgi:hypothetical protein